MTQQIPKEWEEVTAQVSKIGEELRNDAYSAKFAPEAEYKKSLNVLTGCYMYLIVQFKRYRAIKENNEVAKFCELKNAAEDPLVAKTLKFTSAAAEKEASASVSEERYLRDYLEGWTCACEQGIYTIKKHLEADRKEGDISKFEN